MAADIDVLYQGTLRCEATLNKTGQTVRTDVGADHGGLGEYFSPVELVAAALGSCIMSMMSLVGERSGVDCTGLRVHTSLEMAAGLASRFGAVKVAVHVPGAAGVSAAVRKKMETAAHACPVKNSLHPDIPIELEFHYE